MMLREEHVKKLRCVFEIRTKMLSSSDLTASTSLAHKIVPAQRRQKD